MIFTNSKSTDFKIEFDELLGRGKMDMAQVGAVVGNIISEIRNNKNQALKEHIAKFDKWTPKSDDDLKISTESMSKAYANLDEKLKNSLHLAYDRIKAYHEKQKPRSWFDDEPNGIILGQRVTPVDSAGLYIPGGKAAYPSSLLMNVIPAQVAGVEKIVVCTPTPNNEPNELLLAACHLCGVSEVYKVGGASAIAAMAYGTQTIPKVDVITGPGNIFVATAKKMVFGDVNIDMIAGPSEIGILADDSANPSHMAIDMLSQAEHDEMASSILITPSQKLADEVKIEIENWLLKLPRQEIARKSIEERGAIIVTADMEEAITLMNQIAPEHLEVATISPFELLPLIKHAGAIFLGHNTPEAIGDYVAGPNHTLPTGGTAKFYSPLGVENFMKKTSIISFSQKAINEIGEECALIAKIEGLTAHEQSVRVRLKK
ncbi:MAG: histidinol dehydrogenase [Sulfurimonas sp. RIFCSPHIGHO2_12_FULL_36_9]|uniref:histidinol dehydrogenase n=1 Tax=Sulfurimonas sp. RIFCSPLOWO2_12_36_12 TaxID=1802253 RepID=UPI0008BA0338|nr:histidinol dehydrogenase [Sulfurimonas sp. RIFCSPLOWO2_12_36_12]OHD99204.1 MAG: histidinol dehydrogenase [Sulfurimonas sp. RIFCSPHIGHO2_12_FULL_36_9]OHE00007.1 MAG: histidinol dehydrogenase [Sulfurimonas sp. RIFCSPLOWO2_02_FULL_36_28]OHE01179.1 MAG: histidinol dehydrogenase [Sulfurimonas sp. RIFCSPLOWO2_12_36_12]OHE04718.1 MAG: histidinol dehydrogenase [Sulfurimonas sp. RIFCSPLOWO2_12_FULL_36_74]